MTPCQREIKSLTPSQPRWVALACSIQVRSLTKAIRQMTNAIRQMTNATQQIAAENFSVRVEENRNDELRRLGNSINHLTQRLSGFVTGQKRFLGDISH